MANTKMNAAMHYCYYTKLGKPVRRLITRPVISALVGSYMDRAASRALIADFVRKNKIDMSEYQEENYTCFNDFFTRRIKPEARPVCTDPEYLISPCDGYLSAYRIGSESEFFIKNSYYTVEELVGGADIASEYMGGTCLIIRLGVENYHRYCYIDDGFKSRNYHIKGRYNPVLPIVVRSHPIFVQNTREYCIMQTKNFGTVVQIEVGACLVGKIKNHHEAAVIKRGAEKGCFQFGGSTIVLLLREGTIDIPDDLFLATGEGREAIVKFGQAIARKACASKEEN